MSIFTPIVCILSVIYILYLVFFLINKSMFKSKHLFFNILILSTSSLAILSYFFIDVSLANYFHNLSSSNHSIYVVFSYITELGHFFGALIIIGLYLAYERFYLNISLDEIKLKLFAILKALIFSGIFVNIAKSIYGRTRPIELFNNNNYDFYPMQAFSIFKSFFVTSTTNIDSNVVVSSGYSFASFPSGHSISAFVVFSFLAFAYKKYQVVFFALALVIVFSRVILFQHYLSDVLVGSLLGFLFAYYYFHTLNFKNVK